ncbi:hypothetical protein HYALB_00012087 [Hymenoscyphus albidus]|uniref:Xylanolytic transcriptional activator regulatory domain-containing protein n=1 Tax=Hymenoscyphus albidus TaxID=595503 RepID=A0A9N9LMD7_9HELO|nr:hypothetical protein HYALB_00012087 [Hymenoscyphus albidus]
MEEVNTCADEYHEFDLSALVLHNNASTSLLVSHSPTPAPEPVSKTTPKVPEINPTSAPDQRIPRIPKIFNAFPKSVDSTDMMYLHTRDALTLPSEILQIALSKSYVTHVHWNMPILDLDDFLYVVQYGGGESGAGKSTHAPNKIEFLLFQAVIFAGAEHILYDFDTATDRLSIVQSLLLMTLYSPSPPTGETINHNVTFMKDENHYLNLAISLCYSLGLHRAPPFSALGSPDASALKRRGLEKRMFWTAFIRDRLLATTSKRSLRRLVRIKKVDCQISMLSLADFDITPEADDDDSDETMHQRVSANSYIEKAILCWNGSDTSFDLQHQWPQILSQTMNERPSIWKRDTSHNQHYSSITKISLRSPSAKNLSALDYDFFLSPETQNSYDHPAPSSTISSDSPLLSP